jgi:hypothetical protein
MVDDKYYPIDAYYSFENDSLYCIVKQLHPNGKISKITKKKPKPKIDIIKLPFTKKIQYFVDLNDNDDIEKMTIPYKHYYGIKKRLESIYNGNVKNIKSNFLDQKYPDLLNLSKEIYNDYKLETQFLQQEIFTYDDQYLSMINIAFWDIEILHDNGDFVSIIKK